jgi:DNA-binding transcriptional MerR regulator
MRIAEVAELAGVTVRTVRHYHREGVLPEPPRRANGYRSYTVDDLVVLLRIRELTRTGLSLAQAGRMVAGSGTDDASTDAALDEIDRALQLQIAELVERRRRLARARSDRHVGLSRLAAAMTTAPTDVPTAVLVAHLVGDGPEAERLADALLDPRFREPLELAQRRFEAIDDTTPEAELDDLSADVQRVLDRFAHDAPSLAPDRMTLVQALAERDLNDRQREFLRRHT